MTPREAVRRIKNAGPLHPKVAGGAIGGSLVALTVGCLAWAGVHVPQDVSEPATVLVGAAGAWIAKEKGTAR